jgi:hypothetical protein
LARITAEGSEIAMSEIDGAAEIGSSRRFRQRDRAIGARCHREAQEEPPHG